MQTALAPLLNTDHPLRKADLEWNEIYGLFTDLLLSGYEEEFIRLMSSLVILEEFYELTAEQTLRIWEENPYWQEFSGFQPMRPSCPVSLQQYTTFRRIAGKQRLMAISGMVPILQNHGDENSSDTKKTLTLSTNYSSNSADIRRSLLPNDPSQVSLDSGIKKQLLRSEPHFDTVKPCLVEIPKGKPLVLEVTPGGEGPFTYQWFRWSQSTGLQEAIPNGQQATLITKAEAHSYFIAYRCQVKNAHGTSGVHSRWFFVRPSAAPNHP